MLGYVVVLVLMIMGENSTIRPDGLCVIGLKNYAYVQPHYTPNKAPTMYILPQDDTLDILRPLSKRISHSHVCVAPVAIEYCES
jgi:hypothetical protein